MGEKKISSPEEYFDTLEKRFNVEASLRMFAIIQLRLTGDSGSDHYIVVDDGEMSVVEGVHESPGVTITVSATDFVDLVNGALDGPLAFATGRGQISGDLMLAMQMQKLFPAANYGGGGD